MPIGTWQTQFGGDIGEDDNGEFESLGLVNRHHANAFATLFEDGRLSRFD